METMDGTEKAPFREPGKTSPKGRRRQMKQEDGKGIGDPVHKYYFFPSEARDFSRGYFTFLICNFFTKITNIYCFFMYILLLSEYGGGKTCGEDAENF